MEPRASSGRRGGNLPARAPSPSPGSGSAEGALPHRPPGDAPRPDDGRVRVLVAINPPLWGELVERTLLREPDFDVAGHVEDETSLVETVARAAGPLVVLLDYEAFGPGTESVVSRLGRLAPGCRVLVLARRATEDTVVSVLRAGASGLVGKDRSRETLVAALRAVAAGEAWANRAATARALRQLAGPGRPAIGAALLTRRERDVVEAVCDGRRNREIAEALGISEKTVKTHLSSLFVKAGVASRMALARWARQAGAAEEG
jgi:DNA-binding NarL/FixJ family response regulator